MDPVRLAPRDFATACEGRDARVAAAVEDTAKPVHIIARRDDGIVIEGGKQHVVGAPVVHELLIVPERAIADDQSELAVACAVPVDSPGVRMIANTAAPRIDDDRTTRSAAATPLSRRSSCSTRCSCRGPRLPRR